MILEKFVETANLLDIYSELLSGKQKEYMLDHFENDLSLSEIAKNNDVSRQAVYDNIKRGMTLLNEYEKKLGFYKKRKKILDALTELKNDYSVEKLNKIIDEII